ncbi:T9SS type A sorting domain-containing protein [Fluviicola sp.]|uniref:T9SS type A sorting domain-containing protein n=1 Tax=Fluviicola sp. TaxID=1917219 RepID=UPI0031D3CB11
MKKQITLLASALFVAGISSAQVSKSFVQKKPLKITTSKSVLANGSDEKNGGDVIWSSDFSTASDWTMGNAGTGVQGAFQIGAYPANFTQYITGTTTGLTAPMAFFDGIQYLLSGPVGIQNAWMQTPTIDLSASEVISVSFNQIYRRFNHDALYVEVSTDNGATWTLSKQVNTDAVGNGPTLRNVLTTDFLIGPGVTQGKIRVRWESLTADDNFGSGYGWAIDNFEVIEGYENNIKLTDAYYAYGTQNLTATIMPATQAATAGKTSFGAEIENVGSATQPISFNVTSGAFTATSTQADIAPFADDSLDISFANGFTIPSTVGTYNFKYTVLSDSILDFGIDDTITTPFAVSNNIYAVDTYTGPNSITGSFNGWATQTGDPQIGTLFEIFANDNVGAVQIGIGNVSPSQQDDYIGLSVYASIYKWNATSESFDYISRSEEDHEIVAADFGKLIMCYFPDLPQLTSGGLYLVTAGSYNGAEVPIAFAGKIIAGNTMGYNDGGISAIGLASDGDKVEAPVVRLDFNDYTGIKEFTSASNVSVYPNPFVGTTEVKFDLKADASVSAVVTDLSGRTVATVPASQMAAGSQTIAIDGTSFQAGIYNVTLKVGNETTTKRIVKK